ncbi:MAG: binding-protein-dependent transport system inner rane component [Acidimicrobiaceae bacterium]|nr:binding-protein-dependent transport system inner rane component [Acidimicrobiaceae bacterium]
MSDVTIDGFSSLGVGPAGALVRPRVRQERKRTRGRALAVRTGAPAVLIGIWWIIAVSGVLASGTLPSPPQVVRTFGSLFSGEDLVGQIGISLARSATGLLIGAGAGLLLGTVAGLTRIGEEVLDAPLQMLRTVPFLAVVPLFILWLGIGETPKVALIALATVFPMYLNTSSAVRNVDRKVVEGARSFGLEGLRLVREVVFPLALPGILTGLRFSMGISILALVGAEQINAQSGIGYLMNQAEQFQQVTVIFCCIVVYAVLGLLADMLVRLLERAVLPWRSGVAVR